MNIDTLKENYLSFEGRVNRKVFILRSLFSVIPIFLLIFAEEYLTLYWFLSLLGGWTSFLLCIKRLHDLDKSGWWLLLSITPFGNIILMIYILFFKGTTGPNKFGEDPLSEITALATDN